MVYPRTLEAGLGSGRSIRRHHLHLDAYGVTLPTGATKDAASRVFFFAKADLRGLLRERSLRLRCQAAKGRRIRHCQISEDLSIQLHAALLEAIDELTVAQAIQLGGRADAHDPDGAVLPLFLLAPGVGELQAALDGLFRRPVQL